MTTLELPVWRRCWCYRYGRCLVDCPTADLPSPKPLTDENWQREYANAIADRIEKNTPT